MPIYGAIEAGGTKFICGAGTGPEDLRTTRISTTTPGETIDAAIAWLRSRGPLDAIGIGSFGPVELNRDAALYGHITETPKAGWRNCDLRGKVADGLGVPVAFDTDVNAAIFGEAKWGAARGIQNALYLTIGTGIGGGAILGGHLMHGFNHPEMGHIRIPHDLAADTFRGSCPFHGDCLEGLASGPAIEARGEPDWTLEARYLALGIANLACTVSPEVVIMGGGVMQRAELFDMIRDELKKLINGYVRVPDVVPPQLGSNAGVLGALALAQAIREE